MTRVLLAVCGGLLALPMVGGCGAESEQPAVKTIRWSNWGSPAVEDDFMKLEREILREFAQCHPGSAARIEQIPGIGQYAPKLLMMHVSDSAPDVVTLDASSAAVFIDNDVLVDLTEFIENDPDFELDDYFKNVVDIYRRGDRLYAIPLDFTPMMMYYNKRLLDEAGVSYPEPGWTWDDFLEKARKLTVFPEGAPYPSRFGYHFDSENIVPFWIPWVWTNGGDVLDPTGRRASGYFDAPESIEAVQFLVDLITRDRVAPNLDESKAVGQNAFRAEKAAFDLKGHWWMIDCRAAGIDYGVVSLPTNNAERTTVVYASGLSITRKARHPGLAWEFIKFMTSKDIQIRRVASGLAISGNTEAAAHFAGDPIEDAFIDEVQYARAPWGATVEAYPFVEDLIREMMEDLLYSKGEMPVDQAMRATAKLIDAALE